MEVRDKLLNQEMFNVPHPITIGEQLRRRVLARNVDDPNKFIMQWVIIITNARGDLRDGVSNPLQKLKQKGFSQNIMIPDRLISSRELSVEGVLLSSNKEVTEHKLTLTVFEVIDEDM